MDFSRVDDLIAGLSYRITSVVAETRIKSHMEIDESNFLDCVNTIIHFEYDGSVHKILKDFRKSKKSQTEQMEREILNKYLQDCSSLTSSVRRKRLHKIVSEANDAVDTHRLTLKEKGFFEAVKQIQSKKAVNREKTALLRPEKSIIESIQEFQKTAESHKYIKRPTTELESQIFAFLALNYNEEELIEKWRTARVKSVLNS